MIRCLLFGHEPHPTFEAFRVTCDDVLRRYTFCVRCSQVVAVRAGARPDGLLSDEERDAVLIDSLIDRLRVEVLPNLMNRIRVELQPNLMKAPRRIPRKTAEPTENES